MLPKWVTFTEKNIKGNTLDIGLIFVKKIRRWFHFMKMLKKDGKISHFCGKKAH